MAADTADKRTELFTAIDTIEPDSPTLRRVRNLGEQLSAFVAANEAVYAHLDRFVETLGSASKQSVARWVSYVQSASSVEIELGSGALTGGLRDLLLTLGNYRTQSDGKSFRLFIIVEGRLREIYSTMPRSRAFAQNSIRWQKTAGSGTRESPGCAPK